MICVHRLLESFCGGLMMIGHWKGFIYSWLFSQICLWSSPVRPCLGIIRTGWASSQRHTTSTHKEDCSLELRLMTSMYALVCGASTPGYCSFSSRSQRKTAFVLLRATWRWTCTMGLSPTMPFFPPTFLHSHTLGFVSDECIIIIYDDLIATF